MAAMLLDRFSGGKPEGWIFQAEQYFTYLGFSEKDWLPLPSFYFDGDALIWFEGLFRTNHFYDWNHFKRNTYSSAGSSSCAIESDLDNGNQEEATESKNASDLDGGNLRPADASKVTSEIFDASISNFLHPTDFTSSMVLVGSNCNGDTPLAIKIDEKDYSRNFACKVFVEIPYREINMDFEHSIQTAAQVFEEMSHNCCSKLLANESYVDDDNSEKDKLLAKNSKQEIYELLSHIVEVLSLGQYYEARDIGLQNSGYVDKWFDTGQEFRIALVAWFTWLHRNKPFFDWKHFTKKLLTRFPQRTFTTSVSIADTSRFYIDYVHYATFVPPATSASATVALSHVTNSIDFEDGFTSRNTEADYMLEKLPEKYTNVDSLAFLTGCNAEIATLEGLGTPQIGNATSIEADLVQEPSSIIEGQVFRECSPRDMSKRYVTAPSLVCGFSKQKIENATSIEADLVQEPSSIIEGQVFRECSPRDMSKRKL